MQDFVLPTPKIGGDGEPLANTWEVGMIKTIRAYIICVFRVPGKNKTFLCIHSFNPHSYPVGQILFLSSFYK